MKRRVLALLLAGIIASALSACGAAPAAGNTSSTSGAAAGNTSSGKTSSGGQVTLRLGAYTTPREAYRKLIPIFQKQWKDQTGQDVKFEESYLGSGAQSRAIVEGFEADIAALSLEADIDRITKAGLITHDWKSAPNQGMVSTSIVAFAVRQGNPKGIKDWADLAKSGINVLTPDPKTSGGAQWNILALYGAAYRGYVDGVTKGDDAAANNFLKAVLKNVSAMDKGARESITTFEKGIGDAAITYENEVLVAQQASQKLDLVIPRSTILIENPVAVVDKYVDKHGTRQAAEGFVKFLFTAEAQKIFSDTGGLRSVDDAVAKATASKYPAVQDLWRVADFGGWKAVTPKFFGDTGIYSKAIAEVQRK